ncbi:MAG: UDP-N-acetylmuramoyl-L-alanine--D-glutamate ligase [Rhodospirillaceae bacterium]|nr:UDP-N-acetylmuramoyl-L-alanine--D-glutamate ligase [Rhodospirillaceae bacterium]
MSGDAIRIPCPDGRPAAVFGLARTGLAAARALMAGGCEVWGWDDRDDRRAEAAAAGITLVDLARCDWSRPWALVLSPGVPFRPAPHPVVERAAAAGCPVVSDIELLARAQPEARYIGVTGTNGKSTTTALVGHILRSAGRRVEVGGNLGTAALALAPLGRGGTYVLELSSYQLDLTRSLACNVAVLLNITPDHLDRHGGMEGYIAAKLRIFRNQTGRDTAVIGIDDRYGEAIFTEIAARQHQAAVPVSSRRAAPGGVYVERGRLIDDLSDDPVPVMDMAAATTLPGAHNWQNAAAAYAACRSLGIAGSVIAAAMRSYPGLPHRQELVATIDGIRFVNDSKATNADAAGKALACYETIYWIVGGRPKEGGLAGLEPFHPRIAHAFLIGESMEAFAAALAPAVPVHRCGTLDAAVAQAFALARSESRPGAVVLLSPACASFDQFANFEERGEAFRRLVHGLGGADAASRGSAP